jgi:hypothetical protein
MEDHDFRVIEARAALAEARKRDPGELAPDELREEITRFRKYVRWLIADAGLPGREESARAAECSHDHPQRSRPK